MNAETKRQLRNWLFTLIKILDKIPSIGRVYVIGNGPYDNIMIKLQNHINKIGSSPIKEIVEPMYMYFLIENGFRKLKTLFIKRLNNVVLGQHPISPSIDIFKDTILYYVLTLLDLDDILTLVANWERLDALNHSKTIICEMILSKIKELPLKSFNTYLQNIDQKLPNAKTLNGSEIFIKLEEFLQHELRKQELNSVLLNLQAQPPCGCFPGGTSYREARNEATQLGIQTIISDIDKLSIHTSWDEIMKIGTVLNMNTMPVQKEKAITYLKEYTTQL